MYNSDVVVHRDCSECGWSGATAAEHYRGEIFWWCPGCDEPYREAYVDDDPTFDPYEGFYD